MTFKMSSLTGEANSCCPLLPPLTRTYSLIFTHRYRDNRIVYQKPKNLSKLNDHKSIPVIAIRDFIIRESCPADTTEEDEIKLYMSRQHELDDEALTDEIKDYLNKQKRNNDEIPSADVDDEADDVSIC